MKITKVAHDMQLPWESAECIPNNVSVYFVFSANIASIGLYLGWMCFCHKLSGRRGRRLAIGSFPVSRERREER